MAHHGVVRIHGDENDGGRHVCKYARPLSSHDNVTGMNVTRQEVQR